MARLRFPGRPGYRFDRIGVRYGADEASQTTDHTLSIVSSIHQGLRRFKEVFGDSDEEDEFHGFTQKEINQAEAYVRRLAKVEQLLREKQEEELKECYQRSHARLADLEASGLPISRLPANFRDTYGCVVRSGLVEPRSKFKDHHTSTINVAQGGGGYQPKMATMNRIKLKRLTHTIETPGIPRKPVGRRKKIATVADGVVNGSGKSWTLPSSIDGQYVQSSSFSSKYKTLTQQLLAKATKHRAVTKKNKKKFVMPTKSSRSSRVIKPTKRFLEEDNDASTPAVGKQAKLAPSWPSLVPGETSGAPLSIFGFDAAGDNKINAFSTFQGQGLSLSPFSANREKGFPAFSSAPQPSGTSSFSDTCNSQDKPMGLLDQPLIVEGKRAKKPSLIMRMKLVEDNPEDEIKLQQQILDITSPTKGNASNPDELGLADTSSLSGKLTPPSLLVSKSFGTTKSLIAPAKLFTDSGDASMYHSSFGKKKNRRPGLALPQNNTVVLRQAKLQLNRTALNRSKAALARSLKAQLKREAKQERKRRLSSDQTQAVSAGDGSTLFGRPGSSLSQLSPFSQLHASGIDKQKCGLFEGMEDGVGSFSPDGYGQPSSMVSLNREELEQHPAVSSSSHNKKHKLKSKKSKDLKLAEAQCRASLMLFEERKLQNYPIGYTGPCLVCQGVAQIRKTRMLPMIPMCKSCKKFYANHIALRRVNRSTTFGSCPHYGRCMIHQDIDKAKLCKYCRMQKCLKAMDKPSRWKGESPLLTKTESLLGYNQPMPGPANIKDPTKKKKHKMKLEEPHCVDSVDNSSPIKSEGQLLVDPSKTPKRSKHKSGDGKSPYKMWLDGSQAKGFDTPLSVDVGASDHAVGNTDKSPSLVPVKHSSGKKRHKTKIKQEIKSQDNFSSPTKRLDNGGDVTADTIGTTTTTPKRHKHKSGDKSGGTPKHSKNFDTPLSVDVGPVDHDMSHPRCMEDHKSPTRRSSVSPSKRPAGLTNGDSSGQPTELTVTERVSTRGPRIKHVCRRAAMVFPQQRATFGDVVETVGQRTLTLSALPNKEKQEILARTKQDQKKVVSSDEDESNGQTTMVTPTTDSDPTTTTLPSDKPQHPEVKGEKAVSDMDELEDPFLEEKEAVAKAMKMLENDEGGMADDSEMKKEDEGDRHYPRRKKLALKKLLGGKDKPKKLHIPGLIRRIRCGQCQGCRTQECGVCQSCLDKPKFGGINRLKKGCIKMACANPHYSRKATRAFLRPKSPSEMIRYAEDDDDDEEKNMDKSADYKPPSSYVVNGSSGSSKRSKKEVKQQDGSADAKDNLDSSTTAVPPVGKKNGLDMDGSVAPPAKGSQKGPSSHGAGGRKRYPSKMLEATVNVALADVRMPPGLGKILSHDPYSSEKAGSWKKDKLMHSNKNSLLDLLPIQSKTAYSSEVTLKAHLIRADFKSGYRVETAWAQGFSLTLTGPSCVRTLCYLCGTAGKEELIFCIVCCQPFHDFCLEDCERPDVVGEDGTAVEDELEDNHHVRSGSIYWCCRRCQFCNVCGQQNGLLKCHRCRDMYHPECLGPSYPTKPSRKKNIWVCTKCVRCKSCGATTPGVGTNATWTYDFSLCYKCGKLMDKGNFCPVCHKCYSDDDWDSKMIHCASCESWVHAKCEELTDEMYQLLSCLPEEIVFTCRVCSPNQPRQWEEVLQSEFLKGLLNVVNTLMGSKCTQSLMESGPPRESKKPVNRVGVKQIMDSLGVVVPASGDRAIPAHTPITSPNYSVHGSTTDTCSSVGDGNESMDSFSGCTHHHQKETITHGTLSQTGVSDNLVDGEGGVSVSCKVNFSDGEAIPSTVVNIGDGEVDMEHSGQRDECGMEVMKSVMPAPEGEKGKCIDGQEEHRETGEDKSSCNSPVDNGCSGVRSSFNDRFVSFVMGGHDSSKPQPDGIQKGHGPSTGDQTSVNKCCGQIVDSVHSNSDLSEREQTQTLCHAQPVISSKLSPVPSSVSSSPLISIQHAGTPASPSSSCAVTSSSSSTIPSSTSCSNSSYSVNSQSLLSSSSSTSSSLLSFPSAVILPSQQPSLTQSPLVAITNSDNVQTLQTSNLPPDPSGDARLSSLVTTLDADGNDTNRGTHQSTSSSSPFLSPKKVNDILGLDTNRDVDLPISTGGGGGIAAGQEALTIASASLLTGDRMDTLVCSTQSSKESVSKNLFREPKLKNADASPSSFPHSLPFPPPPSQTTDDKAPKVTGVASIPPNSKTTPAGCHPQTASILKQCLQKKIKIASASSSLSSSSLPSISTASALLMGLHQEWRKTQPSLPLPTPLTEANLSLTVPSAGDLTHRIGEHTLSSGNLTPQKGEPVLSWGDLTPKKGEQSSSSGDLTPKKGEQTLPSGNLTPNKGEPVLSSGDLTPKKGEQTLSSGELIPYKGEHTSVVSFDPLSVLVSPGKDSKFDPKNFHSVKLKIQCGSYDSLDDFNEDMVRIIQGTLSQNELFVTRKKQAHSMRSIFIKLMERSFPWFNVNTCKLWEHNKNLPAGMLKEAVLPPYDDHTYAQWLERMEIPMSPQPSPFKHVLASPPGPNSSHDLSPQKICHQLEMPLAVGGSVLSDTRCCRLCGAYGDQVPQDCGRLLYCGLDDWVHINCALWSAEVFEADDGSLQNVQDCISRGRKLRCNSCQLFGATVGCCASSCPANFHFMCARDEGNLFQEDKRMYCRLHADWVSGEVVEGDGFETRRRVCVDIDKTRNKGWGKAADPALINVVFGSCTVDSLGMLSPSMSDTLEALLPINFCCTRIYWSTRDARRRCVYTCRIVEIKPAAEVSEVHIQDMRIVHDVSHPDYVPLDQLDLGGLNIAGLLSADLMTPTPTGGDSDLIYMKTTGTPSAPARRANRSQSHPGENTLTSAPAPSKPLNLTGLSSSTLALLNIKDPEKYVPPSRMKSSLALPSRPPPKLQNNADDLGLLHIANRLNSAALKQTAHQPALRKGSLQKYGTLKLGPHRPTVLQRGRCASASPVMFGQGTVTVIGRRDSSEESDQSLSGGIDRRARSESPYTRPQVMTSSIDSTTMTTMMKHCGLIRRCVSVSPQPTIWDGRGGRADGLEQQAMVIPMPIVEVPEHGEGGGDHQDTEELGLEEHCNKRLDDDVTPGSGGLVDGGGDSDPVKDDGGRVSVLSDDTKKDEDLLQLKSSDVSEGVSNAKKCSGEEEKEGKSGSEEEEKEEEGDSGNVEGEKSDTGNDVIKDGGGPGVCKAKGEATPDEKLGACEDQSVSDGCKEVEEHGVRESGKGSGHARRREEDGDDEDEDGRKRKMLEKNLGRCDVNIDDEVDDEEQEEAEALSPESPTGTCGEKEAKEASEKKGNGNDHKPEMSHMTGGKGSHVSGNVVVISCDSDSDEDDGKTGNILCGRSGGGVDCQGGIVDEEAKAGSDDGIGSNGGDCNNGSANEGSVEGKKFPTDTVTDADSDIFVIDDLSVEESMKEEDEDRKKNEQEVARRVSPNVEDGCLKVDGDGVVNSASPRDRQSTCSEEIISENTTKESNQCDDGSTKGSGWNTRSSSDERDNSNLDQEAKQEKENSNKDGGCVSDADCVGLEERPAKKSGRGAKVVMLSSSSLTGAMPVKEYPLRRRSSNIRKGEEEEDKNVLVVNDDDGDDMTLKNIAGNVKTDNDDDEKKRKNDGEVEIKMEDGDEAKDEKLSIRDEKVKSERELLEEFKSGNGAMCKEGKEEKKSWKMEDGMKSEEDEECKVEGSEDEEKKLEEEERKQLGSKSNDEGPYKCEKCGQEYRTKESCQSHWQHCRFEVTSTSEDEEVVPVRRQTRSRTSRGSLQGQQGVMADEGSSDGRKSRTSASTSKKEMQDHNQNRRQKFPPATHPVNVHEPLSIVITDDFKEGKFSPNTTPLSSLRDLSEDDAGSSSVHSQDSKRSLRRSTLTQRNAAPAHLAKTRHRGDTGSRSTMSPDGSTCSSVASHKDSCPGGHPREEKASPKETMLEAVGLVSRRSLDNNPLSPNSDLEGVSPVKLQPRMSPTTLCVNSRRDKKSPGMSCAGSSGGRKLSIMCGGSAKKKTDGSSTGRTAKTVKIACPSPMEEVTLVDTSRVKRKRQKRIWWVEEEEEDEEEGDEDEEGEGGGSGKEEELNQAGVAGRTRQRLSVDHQNTTQKPSVPSSSSQDKKKVVGSTDSSGASVGRGERRSRGSVERRQEDEPCQQQPSPRISTRRGSGRLASRQDEVSPRDTRLSKKGEDGETVANRKGSSVNVDMEGVGAANDDNECDGRSEVKGDAEGQADEVDAATATVSPTQSKGSKEESDDQVVSPLRRSRRSSGKSAKMNEYIALLKGDGENEMEEVIEDTGKGVMPFTEVKEHGNEEQVLTISGKPVKRGRGRPKTYSQSGDKEDEGDKGDGCKSPRVDKEGVKKGEKCESPRIQPPSGNNEGMEKGCGCESPKIQSVSGSKQDDRIEEGNRCKSPSSVKSDDDEVLAEGDEEMSAVGERKLGEEEVNTEEAEGGEAKCSEMTSESCSNRDKDNSMAEGDVIDLTGDDEDDLSVGRRRDPNTGKQQEHQSNDIISTGSLPAGLSTLLPKHVTEVMKCQSQKLRIIVRSPNVEAANKIGELLRKTAMNVNSSHKEVSVTTDLTNGQKHPEEYGHKQSLSGEGNAGEKKGEEQILSGADSSKDKSGDLPQKLAQETSSNSAAQSRSVSPESLSAAYDIQSDDFSSETSNDGYDESSSSVAKNSNGDREMDDGVEIGKEGGPLKDRPENNDIMANNNNDDDDDDDDVILVDAHGLQPPDPVIRSTNINNNNSNNNNVTSLIAGSSRVGSEIPRATIPASSPTVRHISPGRSGTTSAFSPPIILGQRQLSNCSVTPSTASPSIGMAQKQQSVIITDVSAGRYFIRPSNPALVSPPTSQIPQHGTANLVTSSGRASLNPNQPVSQHSQAASTLLQSLAVSQPAMIFPPIQPHQHQQPSPSLHLQRQQPASSLQRGPPNILIQQQHHHLSPPGLILQAPTPTQQTLPAPDQRALPVPIQGGGITPGSIIQSHNPLSGGLPFVSLTGTPGLTLTPQINLQPTPILQTGVALNAAGQPIMLTSQPLITPTVAQPSIYLPGMMAPQPPPQIPSLIPQPQQPPPQTAPVLQTLQLPSLSSQANILKLNHSPGIPASFQAPVDNTPQQWPRGHFVPTGQGSSSIPALSPSSNQSGSHTAVTLTSSHTSPGQMRQQSGIGLVSATSTLSSTSPSSSQTISHFHHNTNQPQLVSNPPSMQQFQIPSTSANIISSSVTMPTSKVMAPPLSNPRPKTINYMGSFDINSTSLQSLFKATAPPLQQQQPPSLSSSSQQPASSSATPISEMERNRSKNIIELVKMALANRDKVVPGVEVRPVITDTPQGPKKVLRVFIDEDYLNRENIAVSTPLSSAPSSNPVCSGATGHQFTSLLNSTASNNNSDKTSMPSCSTSSSSGPFQISHQRMKSGCNAIQEGLQLRRPLKLVHSSQAQKRKQAAMSAIDMATESKKRQLDSMGVPRPGQIASQLWSRKQSESNTPRQDGRENNFLSVLDSEASRYPPYRPSTTWTNPSSLIHDNVPEFLRTSSPITTTSTASTVPPLQGSASLSKSEHLYHQAHQHHALSDHPRLQPTAGTVSLGSPHKRASFPQGQKVRKKKTMKDESSQSISTLALLGEDGHTTHRKEKTGVLKRKKNMSGFAFGSQHHRLQHSDENREAKKKKRGGQKMARMKGCAGGAHPIIHHKKAESSLPQPSLEEEVVATPLNPGLGDKGGAKSTGRGGQSRANESRLKFEITSDDGFSCQGDTMEDAWNQVVEKVKDVRVASRMKQLSYAGLSGQTMFGVDHDSVVYLIEQLYGAVHCHQNYRFKFHRYNLDLANQEVPLNPSGCARTEGFTTRKPFDMFNFLKSVYRIKPGQDERDKEEEMALKSARRATSLSLPMAMRFRKLKTFAKEAVDVYRSKIHGRGLFCKRNIDAGEMVIEYAGEVIRASLTDKREKYYESKGIGCYMFRIDDDEVVDATMHGSAARFINHSCEPNCFSKVIQVDGKKHIVIFAIRPIKRGEELTYDYKFPIEEVKIPCHCESKKCRKYLN